MDISGDFYHGQIGGALTVGQRQRFQALTMPHHLPDARIFDLLTASQVQMLQPLQGCRQRMNAGVGHLANFPKD